jgi:hypothetical protein
MANLRLKNKITADIVIKYADFLFLPEHQTVFNSLKQTINKNTVETNMKTKVAN